MKVITPKVFLTAYVALSAFLLPPFAAAGNGDQHPKQGTNAPAPSGKYNVGDFIIRVEAANTETFALTVAHEVFYKQGSQIAAQFVAVLKSAGVYRQTHRPTGFGPMMRTEKCPSRLRSGPEVAFQKVGRCDVISHSLRGR